MRIWIKAVLALAAIAAMLWLIVNIGGFMLGILGAGSSFSAGHDPQFAEAADSVTAPPELTGEEEGAVEYRDNSANWDTSVQTPVDKTADELAAEERMEQN